MDNNFTIKNRNTGVTSEYKKDVGHFYKRTSNRFGETDWEKISKQEFEQALGESAYLCAMNG